MKKIVPDPPRHTFINTPFFSIHSEISPPDALAHACELMRGVIDTIDDYCQLHAGEPGLNILSNAAHATDSARVLAEHALARISREPNHD
ncbi:hypothetical protein [Pseudomonas sp. PSKL.D1]|uniref:hypothetical protein n=1 Tax=Pseudomonas sp. PSKL.D1 TaxID=3029060 RepID=UPI0023816B10|nr:hypothetical protein [Pseudomonas sp. PSKL.D1]WDY57755.1 hypothetical protein PVV54_24840 [Pseudomonas sp. PSKL.D1]